MSQLGSVRIRPEAARDRQGVYALVCAAFGGTEEALLVQALHDARDAEIALVAEAAAGLVGHILFSRLDAPFPALALAPLAVAPGAQGQGVGSALIREGLQRAARAGWRAVFVLGDPAYYQRFGFDSGLAAGFASPYAGEHFMAIALDGPLPAGRGELRHPPAFATLG